MSDKVAVDTLRYLQVLESGQRHRLPDWLVWNADASLLDGVATDADVGNDYVIMVISHFFLQLRAVLEHLSLPF